VTTRRRRPQLRPFDVQMLAIADALFREFDELPVLQVIAALNTARLAVARPGVRPDPATIAVAARLRLFAEARGDAA
jgi:hypothetical protein